MQQTVLPQAKPLEAVYHLHRRHPVHSLGGSYECGL